MFNKILIANRGEIAVRIIRACKEMGITTVAVVSEIDKDALHAQLADEYICIGSNNSKDSYLNMENIISAACITKAQAIHPGFGFLSESSVFAAMCGDCNIKFIGPTPESIELLGNKINARNLMIEAGIPVIPGSNNIVKTIEEAECIANDLGYPIVIKAISGGGGKGIRIVENASQLENAFNCAKHEAKINFSNDNIYIEKIINNARHIEIQILSDEHGNIVHLGERDCSLQRKNQKIIEEAPCIALSDKKRKHIGKIAITAAKVANYTNAGTIEFLYDQLGNFYFMEMNTRIQVEHPVTEMITGVDIIKEQIKIANGEKLSYTQDDIIIYGHAIECRINAENPLKDFSSCPGKIEYLFLPSGGLGVRVDSGVYAGYTIPPHYDSMIAKVITHGFTREEAIRKMKRALDEFVIRGIDTNLDFQSELIDSEQYLNGDIDTNFVNKFIKKDNIDTRFNS